MAIIPSGSCSQAPSNRPQTFPMVSSACFPIDGSKPLTSDAVLARPGTSTTEGIRDDYIFDVSDARGCVGSAYGGQNLLGAGELRGPPFAAGCAVAAARPQQLPVRHPSARLADMDVAEVIRLEASWKERLHTRQPFGLKGQLTL